MASLLAEYQRFLDSLYLRPVDEDVCRMANMVYLNLEHLSQVGSARRARSNRLAPIAINHLAATDVAIPEFQNIDHDTETNGRLHKLTVGPFRGFSDQEIFDLSNPITLVYGANGTGKSSFCEALETALLGSISEAQVKRINHNTYCNNARLGHHATPALTIVRGDQDPEILYPNEEKYRFCFIEKNRLDDFARIASRTPSDQRQLIATLFGVDQFTDFVKGFNPSLDENLNLTGQKTQELAIKRLALSNAQKVIDDYSQKLAQIAISESELAARIQPNSNFQLIFEWLLGSETQQGRLSYIQGVLDALPPSIYGVSSKVLASNYDETYRIYGELEKVNKKLERRTGEVSYKQLYESVLQLSSLNPDACPACGTNLSSVRQNPYQKAEAGLKQLAELAELQSQSELYKGAFQDAMRVLNQTISSILQAASRAIPEKLQTAKLPQLQPISSKNWLNDWFTNNGRAWQELLSICAEIEKIDSQSRELLAQREALTQERNRLDSYRIEIERSKLVRKTAEDQFNEAKGTVATFEEANRELIEQATAEGPVVEHHNRIKRAYDGFLSEIKFYLSGLPSNLLQGLGQRARDLYNEFNRDDLPVDLLHQLWLPLAENGKIEIEYQGQPGVRYDALAILSEGHIKCLGLAILLSKNIIENCSIVIFDDVVNAIDDEHRNGIWRTFFEDGLLEEKQVVLTSHAEEFLHRIQQELGANGARRIKLYKFLPHLGEHRLRIDSNPPTKNYVLRAQAANDSDDKRDALYNSRAAIESLTDRLWTWMGRRGGGRIELKLSGPRSPWELNNKCSKIRSALRKLTTQSEGVSLSIGALDNLLGVNGGSIEWGYLNSGTHDSQRDGEFDRSTVNTIVQAVSSLDQALSDLQNGR